MDGPLVTWAKRNEAQQAAEGRLAARLLSPLTSGGGVAALVPRESEDAHIKLLQGLIERHEAASKAPWALHAYVLPDAPPGSEEAEAALRDARVLPLLLPLSTAKALWTPGT